MTDQAPEEELDSSEYEADELIEGVTVEEVPDEQPDQGEEQDTDD